MFMKGKIYEFIKSVKELLSVELEVYRYGIPISRKF